MVKRVDFFELFLGADSQSLDILKTLCSAEPQPHETQIITYLAGGANVSATTMFADRLGDGRDVKSFVLRTDGLWIWSSALEYYIQKYHFRAPADFIQHMSGRMWVPPEQIDVQHVEDELEKLRS